MSVQIRPRTTQPRATKTIVEINENWALTYPDLYRKKLADVLVEAISLRRRIRLAYDGPNRHSIYVIMWNPEYSDGGFEA